jgi:predicted nuclease with TOPRIM domain
MNEEQLEAEIERLDAHCERMASDLVDIADDHSRLFDENARLKAEVERLRASSFVTAVPSHQYERVIKAGDELHAFLINYIVESRISSAYLNKLDDDWNAAKNGWDAAKEGKPGA